jgi:hypothetical protein
MEWDITKKIFPTDLDFSYKIHLNAAWNQLLNIGLG